MLACWLSRLDAKTYRKSGIPDNTSMLESVFDCYDERMFVVTGAEKFMLGEEKTQEWQIL